MSLLEKAKNLNFDPSKDAVNAPTQENLPGGTYDVVVTNARFHVYNSGYECIALDFKVVTGEHAEHKEFININVDPDYENSNGRLYDKYPFILERNIKQIQQFAYCTDVKLEDADWEDQVTLGQKLGEARGQQLLMVVEPYKTKKGREGVNYEFKRYDVDDEDLPF